MEEVRLASDGKFTDMLNIRKTAGVVIEQNVKLFSTNKGSLPNQLKAFAMEHTAMWKQSPRVGRTNTF